MAALTFFAYFFLGLGPPLAFFLCFIAQKSFLTLLTFFSCFLWLVVLLVTAAIFKGFEPWVETTASFAGVLVASVFIQECVRVGVWFLHKKSMSVLEDVARDKGHRFVLLDKLYVSLAWGFGHAACHIIFFFVSFLSLTNGSGTYYLDTCPQMSIFLMAALYSLAFGMLLSAVTVINFEGFHNGNWLHVAVAPVAHFTASLLTLLCLQPDGCMVAMPVNLAIGFSCVCYAAQMAWRKGVDELAKGHDSLLNAERRPDDGTDGASGVEGVDGGGELQPMGRQGSAGSDVAGVAGGLRARRGGPAEPTTAQ